MDEVQVVVAHSERVTLRVGGAFIKVDADQERIDVEAEAMVLAPVPVPEILWRRPNVLAIAALPGRALGKLGQPSAASPAAWAAAGAAIRTLHETPPPPWPGRQFDGWLAGLDEECERLVAGGILPADVVARNREVAAAATRPWTPVFAHGDLQASHVFVGDDDRITGVIDWSEAGRGDAMFDVASLTIGQEDRLGDFLAGYGTGADVEAIRGYWSLRSLLNVRWLLEHGFDPFRPGCEVDVLRARM